MDLNKKSHEIVLNEKNVLKKFIKKNFLRIIRPFLEEIENELVKQDEKYNKKSEDNKELLTLIEKNNNQRLNIIVDEYGKRLNTLEENIRNNNELLITIGESLDKNDEMKSNIYKSIDYFDFEDHFRGSRELIKERQKQYIPYYLDRKNVIDLGCGRGEFLELLNENEINCIGVDAYPEVIDFCRNINLKVVQDDAIEYLKKQDSVDGIFAGQLIEHMTHDRIIELCNLAYSKLQVGSYLIFETPNPMSLSIFSHAFYIDPSHEKPVHPYTVKYYLEKSGFKEIEIIFPESSRLPVNIPELNREIDDNIMEFNQSMKIVSEQLFSSQDYAIIAKK